MMDLPLLLEAAVFDVIGLGLILVGVAIGMWIKS